MKHTTTLIGGALASVLLAPAIASASMILDTGTPSSSSGGVQLTNTQWVAAQFSINSAENITSLSAYMAPLYSTTYQYDIYSNSNFLSTRVGSLQPLDVIQASYTGSTGGWSTTNTSNLTLGPGTYWLALEITASAGRGGTGLDLPNAGISTSTGTASAQQFAFYGSSTNGVFSPSSAADFGAQITASPVPLPAAVWLLGSGLGAFAAFRRRRTGASHA